MTDTHSGLKEGQGTSKHHCKKKKKERSSPPPHHHMEQPTTTAEDGSSSCSLGAPTTALDAASERARARAARFGTTYQEPTRAALEVAGVDAPTLEALASAGKFGAGEAGAEAGEGGGGGGGVGGAPRGRGSRQQHYPHPPATGSGIDPFSREEQERNAARAARFGTKPFDAAVERTVAAGLSADALDVRRRRRANAMKFGTEDALDREEALAALAALGPVWEDKASGPLPEGYAMPEPQAALQPAAAEGGALPPEGSAMEGGGGGGSGGGGSGGGGADEGNSAGGGAPAPPPAAAAPTLESALAMSAALAAEADPMQGEGGGGEGPTAALPPSAGPRPPLPPAEVLPAILHVRAWRYLPASSGDILGYFGALRPSRVEWLNGVSVNVHFADDATASRALELAGEACATVPSVPPVHPSWRTCLRPLIKTTRTDKYAPQGAETSIWIRRATTHDTKANAAPTHGALFVLCARAHTHALTHSHKKKEKRKLGSCLLLLLLLFPPPPSSVFLGPLIFCLPYAPSLMLCTHLPPSPTLPST